MFCGPTFKDGKPNPLANEQGAAGAELCRQQGRRHRHHDAWAWQADALLPVHRPRRCIPWGQDLCTSYDPAKARALLAEAGFPNGFETSILSLSGNVPTIANNLAIVQQMWGQVGVKLRIEQVDNATRTAPVPRRGLRDANLGYWTNDISDPSQFTSYAGYYPNIHSLHSQWRDERVDKLVHPVPAGDRPGGAYGAVQPEIQERYSRRGSDRLPV